jgi:signal transduction histidine kinase
VHLDADGSARSGCGAPAAEVELTVTDSGPGIPDELREKIFYPFFTTKQKGSGVGLATAQKIVASHGGSLELDPHCDAGSRFRLRLPCEDRRS